MAVEVLPTDAVEVTAQEVKSRPALGQEEGKNLQYRSSWACLNIAKLPRMEKPVIEMKLNMVKLPWMEEPLIGSI